jgi:addiction module HigA family antidote
MKMHNPPHPGEVLKALCLEPLNLTIADAARSLGVSRKTLSAILNGRAGIAFDTTAESWFNQQPQYDPARRKIDRRLKSSINKIPPNPVV